jgi:hypothetical protein
VRTNDERASFGSWQLSSIVSRFLLKREIRLSIAAIGFDIMIGYYRTYKPIRKGMDVLSILSGSLADSIAFICISSVSISSNMGASQRLRLDARALGKFLFTMGRKRNESHTTVRLGKFLVVSGKPREGKRRQHVPYFRILTSQSLLWPTNSRSTLVSVPCRLELRCTV